MVDGGKGYNWSSQQTLHRHFPNPNPCDRVTEFVLNPSKPVDTNICQNISVSQEVLMTYAVTRLATAGTDAMPNTAHTATRPDLH